jgi:hypothetical protein
VNALRDAEASPRMNHAMTGNAIQITRNTLAAFARACTTAGHSEDGFGRTTVLTNTIEDRTTPMIAMRVVKVDSLACQIAGNATSLAIIRPAIRISTGPRSGAATVAFFRISGSQRPS